VADPAQLETPGRVRSTNARHDGDLRPFPGAPPGRLSHRVFVSDEASLNVSFTTAQDRLTYLVYGGELGSASAHAYSNWITGLARLVHVHFQDLAARGDSAGLALRWEASEPGGGLFPALDADIILTPAGERSARLTLTGVYRLPPGSAGTELDQADVRQGVTATIRAFLHRMTDAISHPAWSAEPGTEAADPDPSPLPPEPETP
jgi:hypothetical protein